MSLKTSAKTELSVDKSRFGEMMWLGHFVSWAGKPKNLGMDTHDATLEFQRKCREPDGVLDNEGLKKTPERVWVKTNDIVGLTNSCKKAQECEGVERVNKKATEEDMDKGYTWLH